MMVLEVILFATMVFLALIFLYQLTPSSTQQDEYTNELKNWGDDALYSLYNAQTPSPFINYPDYPRQKLVHYFVSNDYTSLTTDLDSILPPTVLYNIYLSNGSQMAFWCNSFADNTTVLPVIHPVTICHYYITIDSCYLQDFPDSANVYLNNDHCIIRDLFPGYTGETYDVILEMWYK